MISVRSILITGAAGFIGSALCRRLASDNKVIGTDILKRPNGYAEIIWEQADLTNWDSITAICEKYSPSVVIHCAGIAHQKMGAVDSATYYMRVNSKVTENLAKAAAESNPDVCFIFLSSVSVYGEGGQGSEVSGQWSGKTEDGECWPSSDYAVSKLDAEMRLRALYDEGKLHNLVILRLAPVYDRDWSLNLDRRVFAPGKLAYLRFGSGSQRMSALARPNLIEFIVHILQSTDHADFRRLNPQITQISTDEHGVDSRLRGNDKGEYGNEHGLDSRLRGNDERGRLRVFNVCDAEPYEFNTIIRVFKKSGIRPNIPVIHIPLFLVWFATRIAGVFFPKKREWIHSCYEKLASDLIFDNKKMLETGFRPRHTLETILSTDYADYTD